MTEDRGHTAAVRDAIARIPRERLPRWLAETLDLLARDAASFPPPDETVEFPEHIYPH